MPQRLGRVRRVLLLRHSPLCGRYRGEIRLCKGLCLNLSAALII